MDPEHLDHWGTRRGDDRRLRPVRRQHPVLRFRRAVHRPSGGAADDPAAVRPAHHHLWVLAAGRCARRPRGAGQARLDVRGVGRPTASRNRSRTHGPFRLPMLGSHNVQNALAAMAVGVEMEIDDDTLRSAFLGFKGVKRRFTKTGEAGGITVIDDYGHHPVEIAAVLKAARQAGARDVIAVVQPHRYTRLAFAVQRVLHLHERCRHGDRRRRLSGRRGADPRHRPRRAGGRPARARPPQRGAAAGPGASGRDGATPWPSRAISSSASAPATSPNGPPRCRQNWPRCRQAPARCRGVPRASMAAPIALPDLIDTLPPIARAGAGGRAAGAVHLVPRRRPGRIAGAPGRRGRPRRGCCMRCRTTCRCR